MTFTPHIQLSQNDEDGTSASQRSRRRRVPGVVARGGVVGRVAGWPGGIAGPVGGGPGRMAGRVGWQAGSGGGPGQVAGRVRWWAGSGGGPGDRRGMELLRKKSSGVNIVT